MNEAFSSLVKINNPASESLTDEPNDCVRVALGLSKQMKRLLKPTLSLIETLPNEAEFVARAKRLHEADKTLLQAEMEVFTMEFPSHQSEPVTDSSIVARSYDYERLQKVHWRLVQWRQVRETLIRLVQEQDQELDQRLGELLQCAETIVSVLEPSIVQAASLMEQLKKIDVDRISIMRQRQKLQDKYASRLNQRSSPEYGIENLSTDDKHFNFAESSQYLNARKNPVSG